MKKRWIASLLTVAMMLSVMSPLSAYADDGEDLFDDDYGYAEECDTDADEEGIHYYTEEDFGSGDAMIAAQAAQTYTLDQLRSKYPAGKYWNHVGSSTNNPGGYTSTPCSDHWDASTQKYKIGAYDNYYYGALGWATQCAGFANQLAYCYTGSDPQTWTKLTDASAVDNLKTGDVVRYRNNGHSIFVTAVNGNTVYFADCNWGNNCVIRWDKTISKSDIKKTFTSVRVAPETNPQPTVDTCSDQYAGWYKVNYATGINVNSGHNFNSKIDELSNGTLVYVDKASGMGSGQIGHIHYHGQECYLAMNLLTKMTGDPIVKASWSGSVHSRTISVYGTAFDWDNTDQAVKICIETETGEQYTCTADKESTSIPQYYPAATDKSSPGGYHSFQSEYFTLPKGRNHKLKVIAYNVDNGQPVESLTMDIECSDLTSLNVESMPDKTEYTVGDQLDTTGLALAGHYGEPDAGNYLINSGFTCTPEVLNTAGTQTITVSYDGVSTSFDVTVKAKENPTPTPDDNTTTKPDKDNTTTKPEDKLESLEIDTLPNKTTYTSGDQLDTTGLILKATYSVSGEKYITDGYTCDLSALYVTGLRTVTVRYDGAETSFNIMVNEASSNTNPSKPSGDNTTTKPGNTVTTPSDNGSGMAAALLVGGAVVVVGGIVMMAMTAMPVEVRATAQAGDHAVVANMPVALLQGDRVVAETVTDGNGQFTFNVQRGDYTLRLTVTDPVTGQTSLRYASISAPTNGSVIWF